MKDLTSELSQSAGEAYRQEKYDQAAELYRQVQAALQQSGDALAAAEMANNRSVALLKNNQAAAALDAARGTDEIFAAAGDGKRQAIALANQAAALEGLKQDAEALQLYRQSNELLKESGDHEMRSYVLQCISAIQLRHGSQFEAMASMHAAIENKPRPGIKDKFLKRLIEQVNNLLLRK